MTKSDREIMEILEAFDLTRCAHSAAELAGCDPKTISRYVAVRDAGGNPFLRARRARLIDPFLEKIEELVDCSKADIRADVVHDRIVATGFDGDARTTRRAVAEVKAAWRAGNRRRYRPWVPEPGRWCQFDWGDGPTVGGRKTCLFCAWLAWSRYRIVIPTWDRTMGTLVSCLDATLRRLGGAPTYLLSDNENDRVLAALAEGGLDAKSAVHPFDTLLMFMFGSVLWEIPRAPDVRGRLVTVALDDQAASHVVARATELSHRDATEHFEAGLQAIMNGFRPHRAP